VALAGLLAARVDAGGADAVLGGGGG
jgi:hypothetical protein